jgi:hypothetical protein
VSRSKAWRSSQRQPASHHGEYLLIGTFGGIDEILVYDDAKIRAAIERVFARAPQPVGDDR